jgi:nicotinamide-nucleotide amidase
VNDPALGFAAVVCIGNELTEGRTLDTHGQWVSLRLGLLGFHVVLHVAVPDEPQRMLAALRYASAQAAVVVVAGGLGPTLDDLTRDVAAELIGEPLEEHGPSLEHLEAIFARLGRTPSSNNRRQGMLPRGASVLQNPIGTAPGFSLLHEGTTLFFLPGVPRELYRMFEREVTPQLQGGLGPGRVARSARLDCFGIPESEADRRLAPLFPPESSAVRLGFNVSNGILEVHLTATAGEGEGVGAALDLLIAEATERAREALEPAVFGDGQRSLQEVCLDALGARGLTLGLAESCTGGLATHLLTRVPGSSAVLKGAVVAYANQIKKEALGVPEELLAAHGAVSEPVAAAMANGARRALSCDVSIAITGIAGPSGGSKDKPVGTVCLAVSGPGEALITRRVQLPGERTFVQRLAALAALEMLRRAVG